MEFEPILTAITTVGFPIVMTIALMWYVKESSTAHRQDLDKINEHHAEEMKGVREALNNNTLALQRLCDKLDKE